MEDVVGVAGKDSGSWDDQCVQDPKQHAHPSPPPSTNDGSEMVVVQVVDNSPPQATETTCDDAPPQPDGGFGWLVAAASFVTRMLAQSPRFTYSIVFSEMIRVEEGSSGTLTSTIVSLHCVCFYLIPFFGGPVISVVGWRITAFVFSFITCLGWLLSAFATSATFLFFSFSLLVGCGSGMLSTLSNLAIPKYFHRRLALVMGITQLGNMVALMVTPPLTVFLMEEYGSRGATIVTAAISLTTCVFATMLHPAEWHYKRPRKVSDAHIGQSSGQRHNYPGKLDGSHREQPSCRTDGQKIVEGDDGQIPKTSEDYQSVVLLECSEQPNDKTLLRSGGSPSLTGPTATMVNENMDKETKKTLCASIWAAVCQTIFITGNNLQLLKSATALFLVLSASFVIVVASLGTALIPDVLLAKQFAIKEVSLVMAVAGISRTISTLLFAILFGCISINLRACFITSSLVCTLSLTGGCTVWYGQQERSLKAPTRIGEDGESGDCV